MIKRKCINKKILLSLTGMFLGSFISMPVYAAPCSHQNTEIISEEPASCTTEGHQEGIFCNDCESYISGHAIIPALGHIDSNEDGICDDCETKFTFKEAKKVTCTENGYTGDKRNSGRVIIGENIPAPGHQDNNKDHICDVCHASITKKPITITLHYYVTDEEYEENKEQYTGKRFSVKESAIVPGCKYITEKREELQNTEFDVPEAPIIKGFVFVWSSGNTIYQRFQFDKDTELFMSYLDKNINLEGQAGDNAYYIYHPEEKLLEFTGTGSLWNDFKAKSEIPWYKYLMKSENVLLHNKISAKLWTISKD